MRTLARAAALTLAVAAGGAGAVPPLPEGDAPPLLMSVRTSGWTPPAPVAGAAGAHSFFGEESALTAAFVNARTPEEALGAARALANFYVDRSLYVEALGVMRLADPQPADDATKIFVAGVEYRLGRYEEALETLAGERLNYNGAARGLRGMALARIGAYARAKENLIAGESPDAFGDDFLLAKAAAGIATDDLELARQALLSFGAGRTSASPAVEANFLAAQLSAAEGSDSARDFRTIERVGVEPFASRAALASVLDAQRKGRRSVEEALGEIRAIALRWSGGEFDREVLSAVAALATDVDAESALEARRALVERHPLSDAASKARPEITAMLPKLLGRHDLSPGAAARLFYENIEYAPPGSEGDELIRRVAMQLTKLDLLADAAELLEHQVFSRLRGTERSTVAADLAQIYLDDRRPGEALRVIRSTRIAGLSSADAERRRLLEAAALDRLGSFDAAASLLSDMTGAGAARLRADILWRRGAWREAGQAYREVVMAAPAPLDAQARADALRVAAAFLKAGDEEAFAAFQRESSELLAGSPEGDIVKSLMSPGASPASFLDAYRELYGEGGAG